MKLDMYAQGETLNAPNLSDWRNQVRGDLSSIVRLGLIGVGGFFVILVLWSLFLPIASAVVGFGTVISSGHNKVLQHPTGGVVEQIHVSDGQRVDSGDPVIQLNTVTDFAELQRLSARLVQQKALLARLEAQVSGSPQIEFPSEFFSTDGEGLRASRSGGKPRNERLAILMKSEEGEFLARRERLNGEVDALRARLENLKREGEGAKATLRSLEEQHKLTLEQVRNMRDLERQGLVARNRLIDLERDLSDVNGRTLQTRANIDAGSFQILEIQRQIDQILAGDLETDSGELAETRARVEELANQIIAARQAIEQKDIRASVSGIITNLSVHTLGGVVRPGDVLAEIVPEGSDVLVEVQVTPADIDNVEVGQEVTLVITAFNRRLYDPVLGEVSYIAADSVEDERTQERTFTVRVKLKEQPKSADTRLQDVRAGMQAEVYFQAGERSFVSYLLAPISDSFRRAFREY